MDFQLIIKINGSPISKLGAREPYATHNDDHKKINARVLLIGMEFCMAAFPELRYDTCNSDNLTSNNVVTNLVN